MLKMLPIMKKTCEQTQKILKDKNNTNGNKLTSKDILIA